MRDKPLACPTCGSFKSVVVDSRDHPYREAILRRRRVCQHCQSSFYTNEYVTKELPERHRSSTNIKM